MNVWHVRICGIVTALCLFVILLISSAEYCIYYRKSFYPETYEKYHVADAAHMEINEILRVSDHLISYLRGNEDTLDDFRAVVDGKERPFYSEREKLHMKDVQQLFTGALWIRRICLVSCAIILFFMRKAYKKRVRTYVLSVFITFILNICAAGCLAVFITSDFQRAFTGFHHIFFQNDLWLLDPSEDWIIRLLPQEFFRDMALSIGLVFGISVILVLAACGIWLLCLRKRSVRHTRRLCRPV